MASAPRAARALAAGLVGASADRLARRGDPVVGTLFFNVTTFAGMKHGLSTSQSNRRVWAPDALGSICFLVSSELAYAGGLPPLDMPAPRSLSWWIVALNLLGSLAFGAAAIGSLLEPSTGEPISSRIANGGTALWRAVLPARRARADAGGSGRGPPRGSRRAADRRSGSRARLSTGGVYDRRPRPATMRTIAARNARR